MKSISNAFRALADPTRRQILQELKRGELSAGAIAACFTISGPSISRHLSILKNTDLISERRVGNPILYRLEPEQIAHTLRSEKQKSEIQSPFNILCRLL